FGSFVDNAYLPHSVYGYFLNGGGSAYVVSIRVLGGGGPNPNPPAALPAAGELTSGADNGKPAFTVRALTEGTPGQDLSVEVTDATEANDDTFKLVVSQGG